MQTQEKHGKLLSVRDGYLICPYCRVNKRVMRIDPATTAQHVVAYCRQCKREIIVDIDKGQSFESRSQ